MDGGWVDIDLDSAQAAPGQVGFGDETHLATGSHHARTEGLDERAERVTRQIEHAVLAIGGVEAIGDGTEVEGDRRVRAIEQVAAIEVQALVRQGRQRQLPLVQVDR